MYTLANGMPEIKVEDDITEIAECIEKSEVAAATESAESEGAFSQAEIATAASSKAKYLRHIGTLFKVTLAIILILYSLIPRIPKISRTEADKMLIAALFGELSGRETEEEPGKLPSPSVSLSRCDKISSPLASFDDDSLREILYASNFGETGKGEHPIKPVDLSVSAKHGLSAKNETAYDIKLFDFLDYDPEIPSVSSLAERYGEDAPVVLIVHTHGTEAYTAEGANTYTDKDNCRSSDITQNVVAVGEVMAEYFTSVGIPTLHCTEMFDEKSYIEAYDRSAAAIREFVAIYPSIQYVFDVHRDSVIKSDLTKLRPVTVIDGKMTAQYMCVVGTDERAGRHKEWKRNLAIACQLQAGLWQRSNSLVRRMSIRSASYNQAWAPGSLLLEIGSCGNTLTEAKACGKAVAEEIAKIILKQ